MKKFLRYLLSRDYLFTDSAILLYLAMTKLLLHLFASTNFGIHRDEFLYLAMGDHMEWGFRETPPSIAYFGNLITALLGDNVFAIRFLPALLGSLMVLLTGASARLMGGGRYAMAISGLAVLIAPLFLRSSTLFQPVIFNQFYWILASFLFINAVLQKRKWPWWLAIGVVCGVGLLNKYTMLLWGGGIAIGLLISNQRRQLLTPWPWLALIIACLIFFPNIQWQQVNNWPLFEHLAQLQSQQLTYVTAPGFLMEQVLMLHPANIIIWPLGLLFYFVSKTGNSFRALGCVYIVSLLTLLYLSGKSYYLGPAYPAMIAGGAIFLERFILSKRLYWLKPMTVIGLLLSGVVLAPYGAPVLPVRYMEFYVSSMAEYVGLDAPLRTADGQLGKLPQDYSDMHGWQNQVNTIAGVYNDLSEEDKAECVILASNYGEAGSLSFFGPAAGLPKPISFHSSFYNWGPGERPGNVVITVGIPLEELKKYFGKIRRRAVIEHRYAIRYENQLPVYLCRNPVKPLQELWPEWKIYQ